MREFARPKVVISKCLEFERCRWNGEMISSQIAKRMMGKVDFLPICPEVEIGLGVPRDPIRVIRTEGEKRLIQPAMARDCTVMALDFARKFLSALKGVDGFLLKSGSPSCGLKDVKIYPVGNRVAPIGRGSGFFGGEVIYLFGDRAIEDENRLRNYKIAEHFLTKIFTLADFRHVAEKEDLDQLRQFHTKNKLLLMAYSQKELSHMGRIVAGGKEKSIEEILSDYQGHLSAAMRVGPRCSSSINVLMHAMGHFSDDLSKEEKAFMLDSFMDYREGRIHLAVSNSVIKAWIIRFEDEYLGDQTFFQPFPSDILDLDITDNCRIRDYWKEERETI